MSNVEPGIPAPVSPLSTSSLIRPIVGVTVVTVGVHLSMLLNRVAMARLFGASLDLDAYLAALALPQYVTAVVIGVLPQVCVPVIVMTAHRHGRSEALRVSQGIANVVLTATVLLTIVCAFGSSFLLHITAPGLPPPAHAVAARMAFILWPTVVAAAAVAMAASIENAESRFLWPAVVPLIGGLLNLTLLLVLAPTYGISGMAAATCISAVVQMLLLGRVLTRGSLGLRGVLGLEGVREALTLLWPLLLSGVSVRLSIVAERYFGSRLQQGSISEISYASSLIGPLAVLLSVGVATVLFPRMARQAAQADFQALGASLSTAIRTLWILIAPAILVGVCLARSIVMALFQGGRFTTIEVEHVSSLLQIYFVAVAATSLGLVTGRVLYALRATVILSVLGAIEGVTYLLYTALLVTKLGAAGVAWGFVVCVTTSFALHLLVIAPRIGWRPGPVVWSVARTTIAALLAAGITLLITARIQAGWMQLLVAGSAAMAAYVGTLLVVNRPDTRLILAAARELRATS
ncbi:MAG: oligosaccharide flippase family protein [Thermoanaerobaculia bacterium]